jgi:hypothetical protein
MTDLSQKLKTFLFTYECDGVPYNLHVSAYSQAEAVARVRRMSIAIYDGEVVAKIPIPLAWPARALALVRNAFQS